MSSASLSIALSAVHWGIGAILLCALFFFVQQFLVPSWRVGRDLTRAYQKLAALKADGTAFSPDQIDDQVFASDALRHCWAEYRDTLHGQKELNPSGMLEVKRWRATATADSFFTEKALIEAPLRTEFYKHLPGILTGVGIIGTFTGLIIGLQGFKVSEDPNIVRNSLESLISSVAGAFVVSGIAIFGAMLTTTIEKILINRRYTQLDTFCGLIDSLFDSGAGEEYLQRLVEASETSATQAMQMKESLVTDLKQVLSELTQQQIATITSTSAQLGQSITNSLAEGLAEPLERISHAVQSVGNSQGEAVNRLLTDVLASFSSQMENMFGSQLRGMNDMLVKTASTIEGASQRFESLAGQIQQAGAGAADAMAKRMDDALLQMQSRQAEANEQMRAFVDSLKEHVASGQAESADLTRNMMRELSESASALVNGLRDQSQTSQSEIVARQEETNEQMRVWIEQVQASALKGQGETAQVSARLIGELGDKAEALIDSLSQQSALAHEEHGKRQAVLAEQTADLLGKQSSQIDRLADSVQHTGTAMHDAIAQLQSATNSSIERMNGGAERLHGASIRLAENLEAMKSASDGVVGATEKLYVAAGPLNSSLAAVQQTLSDQKMVRDSLASMVGKLESVVENASREAAMTKELVNALDTASTRLRNAQDATNAYLDNLTSDLVEVHQEFSDQITKTLREGNSAFHTELSQATGLLKSAIQDLGDALENLPTAA
ncbi:anti-phage ZorAB system protein ZorA [Paraburkholderia flagellata]|uniref:anti-phage ZorAB system protein ZorA n=1 Tax=Paraburkholderia flagellata TaxID=2883241 RepID=UPI001F3460E8|nr:anti-phage ZorAB system protein ZorA [Paraburkholderia flagellata]